MSPATHRLETADGTVVADRCAVADGFFSRFKGLMGRRELPEGDGLCLQKCSSIHMFFMRIALDVAFVDGDGRVLKVYHGLRPWRVSSIVGGAKAAVELPEGTLKRLGVDRGTVLSLI
jgi:uncharacterized membrane protein (UPF0127 family)